MGPVFGAHPYEGARILIGMGLIKACRSRFKARCRAAFDASKFRSRPD
jgi:hypothetical protein